MSEELSKSEAAKYLQVSPRQLERYTKAAKIGVRYEQAKGQPKPSPLYMVAELERFKAELERVTVTHRPAVQLLESDNESASTSLQVLATSPGGIAHNSTIEAARQFAAQITAQVLAQVLNEQSDTTRQSANASASHHVALSEKPLLKLDEAALLTGLSRQTLRTAIADGTLKAARIGRTWRMRRADVDKYLQDLF